MARYDIIDSASRRAASVPDSFSVFKQEIDLTIERSAASGNLLVMQTGMALFLLNATDANAGGVTISVDAGSNAKTLRNPFFLAAGNARNIPHQQIVVANRSQPGKKAYIESSAKVELTEQIDTDFLASGATLETRNIGTAGGVNLGSIPGTYDGTGRKSDYVMMTDFSRESSDREWLENLAHGATNDAVNWANYARGFTAGSVNDTVVPFNWHIVNYTQAATGNLLGGVVGYDAFYKARFYFQMIDIQEDARHVSDINLLIGNVAGLNIKPRISDISASTVLEGGSEETIVNSVFDMPPFIVAANQTNANLLLQMICSPKQIPGTTNIKIGCEFQRVPVYSRLP